MPFVQIKVIEGVLTTEQKKQMLEKVSEAVISVEGQGVRNLTTVVIEEVRSEDWASGGRVISAEEARAIARGGGKAA
jgi:4-oxalocrotonate tautomerase